VETMSHHHASTLKTNSAEKRETSRGKDRLVRSASSGRRTVEHKYKICKLIGKGAFSEVRVAKHKRTGKKYAIKIVSKGELGDNERNLRNEVAILKSVKHENVIELKDIYETKDTIYLIMELVTGGELFEKIVEKKIFKERDAAVLIRKIAHAVAYLHENNIVHRDLKPENLLLKNAEDDTSVKIADFGLSKILGPQKMMQTACGTPSYVAPEVLLATGYGPPVDMWSIGVITYILLCGFPPFYGDTIPEIFKLIMNCDFDFPEKYWEHISDEAKDFISKLLVLDPEKRYTAQQVLQHPWLKGKANKTALNNVELGKYNQVRKEKSLQSLQRKVK